MNITTTIRCLIAVGLLLGSSTLSWAQRVQFPTQLEQQAQQYSQSLQQYSQNTMQHLQSTPLPPLPNAPAVPTWDPYADPSLSGTTQSMFSPVPQGYYGAPTSAPTLGYPAATGMAAPTAAGTYQPMAPYQQQQNMFGQVTRLFQEFRVQDTWVTGGGLGVNTLETSATFAFPFFYNQAPLLLSPGFAAHWWDGPETRFPGDADLPPRTFDVFIDTAWEPRITDRFSTELGFRFGAFTDFANLDTDSLRYMFRALGVLTYSQQTQFKLGVIYLDRNGTKFLPAGGWICIPNADTRYEIIFPRPKIAKRLTTRGNTNIWGYISGEYGGGSWTVERLDGLNDSFDYNDYRVMGGIEWLPESVAGWRGIAEVGYVFKRELTFESHLPRDYSPSDGVMLRVGLNY